MKKALKNNQDNISVGDLVMHRSAIHRGIKRYGIVWKIKVRPGRKIKYLYVIWGSDAVSRIIPVGNRYLESWLLLIQHCKE